MFYSIIGALLGLPIISGCFLSQDGVKAAAVIIIFFIIVFQIVRPTLAKAEQAQWSGPGKVLLFPCLLSHTRLFPKKHSFSYSYLTVGVPVGFEGNAGGLVSVLGRVGPDLSSLLSFAPRMPRAWFSIDAADYLERGKPELGLRGKLDEYLRTQEADPAAYPYAYLVTAARVLGYHHNPVSFWYLYDADKCLAAMILEVNNTFDERRMYFLTRDDIDEPIDHSPNQQDIEPTQTRRSEQTGSPWAVLKQSWPKDFHVSPFNSRKGSYTLTASDPLYPFMQGRGAISITIKLKSSKGHCKMVARLSSDGAAVDPCDMTPGQKVIFLLSWWWDCFLAFPRVLKEAFSLFYRHRLHMWYRPEPLKDTISRKADKTEQHLEGIFRRYLQHLVEQSATPLKVRYIASGLVQDTTQLMLSSPVQDRPECAPELEFRVLTPVFYKRFIHYLDDLDAFSCELNESRTIWVSHPDLLPTFALNKLSAVVEPTASGGDIYLRIIGNLRVRPERIVRPLTSNSVATKAQTTDNQDSGRSAMDVYVIAHEPPCSRAAYQRCVLKLFLAERMLAGVAPSVSVQRLFRLASLVA
ncbi:hypothetical protein N656DRAFT_715972 [Canariomyces notabilis]|uniref:Uncharacterized protein n=1 Tax=Canariomyces notabilis TaxID=2074819 RepID=A0AAN6QJU9_9PEZI|nr:hypothetical protein N656DRAFT_715972 [Canariomyces arenarius]